MRCAECGCLVEAGVCYCAVATPGGMKQLCSLDVCCCDAPGPA